MNRIIIRAILFVCCTLHILAIAAYAMTYFNWDLTAESVVIHNEMSETVMLLSIMGCVTIILIRIILERVGMRLLEVEKWVQRIFMYLFVFGIFFFVSNAAFNPGRGLRLENNTIEVNDGTWRVISSSAAEKIFLQNIRRRIGEGVCLLNIAVTVFVFCGKRDKQSNGAGSLATTVS
jgi:hypothetical protein